MNNEVINANEKKEQSRWRSPVVWASIVGVIATMFTVFGIWDKIGITVDGFKEIVAAVGALLTAFGVLNNPESKNTF